MSLVRDDTVSYLWFHDKWEQFMALAKLRREVLDGYLDRDLELSYKACDDLEVGFR